jgi:hypothetical protein
MPSPEYVYQFGRYDNFLGTYAQCTVDYDNPTVPPGYTYSGTDFNQWILMDYLARIEQLLDSAYNPGPPVVATTVSGTGIINIVNCKVVDFDVVSGAEFVDRWWGAAHIGKFGVVYQVFDRDGGYVYGPLHFLNHEHSRVFIEEGPGVKLGYSISGNVTGFMRAYQRPTPENALSSLIYDGSGSLVQNIPDWTRFFHDNSIGNPAP